MFTRNDSKCYSSLTDNINIHYYSDFLDKYKADKYYHIFEEKMVYDANSKIVVNGTEFEIKRKMVAYGDAEVSVKAYGRCWNNDDVICRIIKNIKHKVEVCTGQKFNYVLINRYADGTQKIGHHQDKEEELGKNATIAGVSLGAMRDIQFKPYLFIPEKIPRKINLPLHNGSMYVIQGSTNQSWTHAVPARADVKKPRISLTFRYLHL